MTGPGSSETRSHSSSGKQPGVKPVVAVSGRTTSSAPVASTHRVSQSTHFSMLALTTSGLRGPVTGAVWTAAAVKARMSTPPGSDAHGHAGESDRGAELVVLPETTTTGFTPGCSPEQLWDLVSELPGPVIAPIQAAAADMGVHVCVGTYERGQERGV